jgi:hypothetical protein
MSVPSERRELTAPLSPEAELLLMCARPAALPAGRLAAALERCGDHEALLALARRHGMLPLLQRCLGAAGRWPGSPAVPGILHAASAASGAMALRLTAELLSLLDAFGDRGLAALPFKGPILAQRAYGTIAMRQARDLDILLRAADVPRARALLEARGYRAVMPLAPIAPYRFEYQLRLLHERRATLVELHWLTAPPNMAGALTLDDVWDGRELVPLLGHPAPSLGIEDLVLVLCVHGAKHRWERLEWICCLATLLATTPPSWTALLARAQERRCTRMVRVGLLVAAELLDVALPESVRAEARRDERSVALATDAIARLFEAPPARAAASRERNAFQLRLHEGVPGKVRFLCVRQLVIAGRLGARLARAVQPEPDP